ncbi:alpha-2-macroglobulin family protein [Acuticoccus sp. MNP-M23]|uniref:alpha-2-macroglobulin family protein n=1 Tax=Acuticoccus sp. MNP-M23 TaxID=3072793 RepID=UPI0028159C81|nr:alpha-2-macroglobulin family protein [Acuticoccus sp. MNP-M23]WMS43196.1 alpha-2-macroglobulin family protein [Acuticoccus sp. MNP-M23]
MALRTHVAAGLAALAALLVLAQPAAAERTLERLPEVDLPGFDYRTLRNVPLPDCERVCLADTGCAAFTYNERAQWCFLKSEVGERTPYSGATSAVVRETSASEPPLDMPDVSYLPASYAREAEDLASEVQAAIQSGSGSAALENPAAASDLASGDSGAWLRYARQMLDLRTDNYDRQVNAQREASGAAYLALQSARTVSEQGAGLAMLSAVLERQGIFRPAITASEAGLTLRYDGAEAERLDKLRREHGFRVLDYTVNAEVITPRMCVQFSEPLRGDSAALQRFVTLDGAADPAITVENSQLCVEGLSHGSRYEVNLREGLPATTGETLRGDPSFTVFVRDRAPLARFDTNDYVLPASAEGVPVTTINTRELDLVLYQINDRNLAEVVRRGDFRRQLYPYEMNEIAQERGAEVWKGTMPVGMTRNTEVRTLAPVGDMIGTREPGVYVLTAMPRELANRSEALATQWFVISDLGLSTFSNRGTVDVFARSLATAEPLEGVALTLLAENDALLATAITDAEGRARLVSNAPVEGSRAPVLVTAENGDDDFAFVSLKGGAFELTDRGVEGRTAPGPVDGFIATERGVYRAGETVNATVLMRNDNAVALDVPVTIKVVRPDGVLSRRIVARAAEAGGTAVEIPLTTNAATGTWQLTAHVDPSGPAVGDTSFLVEDFVPQRIEVALASDETEARAGSSVPVDLDAQFLYGAPAAGLIVEGAVVLSESRTVAAFEGYRFGLAGEEVAPQRTPLENLPRTGPDGSATFSVDIGQAPDATGPLEARVIVSVREPGGRQVGDAITLPVDTGAPMIGIRPAFDDGRVGEGSVAGFDVIAIGAARERIETDATWTLTRIERDFQWYRRGDRWYHDAIERLDKVAEGEVTLGADAPLRISEPVGWGRYRLEVANTDGSVASSVLFDAGWVSSAANAETPDVLEITLDRESYSDGDTAALRITPRAAGKALVTVLSESVAFATVVDVPAEGATVNIPVSADWSPGAYVAATLFRNGDPSPSGVPLPERSVGVAYLDVDTANRRLAVTIDAPAQAEPRQTATIPVRVGGLDAGETAYLTVAAVDIGILNITGYEAPNVDEFYLGQRRLAVELRDLYGDLIDTAGAKRGRIRSGGDGIASGSEALPPTEDSVSLFTGVIETDADGVAEAVFELPAFNGAVRLMAIAWTPDKVGNASTDMTIRDPVVVAASLPRFLAPGDTSRMRMDLHNVAGAAGEYRLSLNVDGPVHIDRTSETLNLGADARDSIEFPITADEPGLATIVATLDGPDGAEFTSEYRLTVRSAAPVVSQRQLLVLSPGETMTLANVADAGFEADATVSVTVGAGDIDTAGLITMLDRFPYGCAEQTVSRALPLLYANDLGATLGMDADTALPERIRSAIDRVLAYQGTTGGFGLWSPGSDVWLTAYVMDFLSRAREAGYEVPDDAFEAGLDRLQSVLSYIDNVEGERGTEVAYATYVLARNGRAAIGDLRYFAEEKLDDFKAPLARAQLAASLAFTGDQSAANRLFQNAVLSGPLPQRPNRTDFGTPLRDAAAIVTLASESRVPGTTIDWLTTRLNDAKRADSGTYSTQEAAWLVLSAEARQDVTGSALVDGEVVSAPGTRAFDSTATAIGVSVENTGTAPLSLASTITGTPVAPLPPVSNGLRITRTYAALDGTPVDLGTIAQNDRVIVTLQFQKTVANPMRIMLTDLLPAGFEVENPRLMSAADVAGVKLVQSGQTPEFTAFRDDRFAAAWTLGRGNKDRAITVSYLVRAISPGTFAVPAAEVSDMYQPGFVARTESGSLSVVPTR